MASTKKSKTSRVARAKQFIAGTTKHFANVSTLPLASGPVTPAQVTSSLTTLVTLRTDVDAARAQAKAKFEAEKTQAPPIVVLMDDLEAYVRALFGKSPEILADFGLTPRKPKRPLTSEEQAAAVAKRDATRAARHTMGPVKRQKVKGNVVGVDIVPVTATPATQGAAAPAGTPTGAAGSSAAPRS